MILLKLLHIMIWREGKIKMLKSIFRVHKNTSFRRLPIQTMCSHMDRPFLVGSSADSWVRDSTLACHLLHSKLPYACISKTNLHQRYSFRPKSKFYGNAGLEIPMMLHTISLSTI